MFWQHWGLRLCKMSGLSTNKEHTSGVKMLDLPYAPYILHQHLYTQGIHCIQQSSASEISNTTINSSCKTHVWFHNQLSDPKTNFSDPGRKFPWCEVNCKVVKDRFTSDLRFTSPIPLDMLQDLNKWLNGKTSYLRYGYVGIKITFYFHWPMT
jgi:hypothetical protein